MQSSQLPTTDTYDVLKKTIDEIYDTEENLIKQARQVLAALYWLNEMVVTLEKKYSTNLQSKIEKFNQDNNNPIVINYKDNIKEAIIYFQLVNTNCFAFLKQNTNENNNNCQLTDKSSALDSKLIQLYQAIYPNSTMQANQGMSFIDHVACLIALTKMYIPLMNNINALLAFIKINLPKKESDQYKVCKDIIERYLSVAFQRIPRYLILIQALNEQYKKSHNGNTLNEILLAEEILKSIADKTNQFMKSLENPTLQGIAAALKSIPIELFEQWLKKARQQMETSLAQKAEEVTVDVFLASKKEEYQNTLAQGLRQLNQGVELLVKEMKQKPHLAQSQGDELCDELATETNLDISDDELEQEDEPMTLEQQQALLMVQQLLLAQEETKLQQQQVAIDQEEMQLKHDEAQLKAEELQQQTVDPIKTPEQCNNNDIQPPVADRTQLLQAIRSRVANLEQTDEVAQNSIQKLNTYAIAQAEWDKLDHEQQAAINKAYSETKSNQSLHNIVSAFLPNLITVYHEQHEKIKAKPNDESAKALAITTVTREIKQLEMQITPFFPGHQLKTILTVAGMLLGALIGAAIGITIGVAVGGGFASAFTGGVAGIYGGIQGMGVGASVGAAAATFILGIVAAKGGYETARFFNRKTPSYAALIDLQDNFNRTPHKLR